MHVRITREVKRVELGAVCTFRCLLCFADHNCRSSSQWLDTVRVQILQKLRHLYLPSSPIYFPLNEGYLNVPVCALFLAVVRDYCPELRLYRVAQLYDIHYSTLLQKCQYFYHIFIKNHPQNRGELTSKLVITVGLEPTIARMKTWSPNH